MKKILCILIAALAMTCVANAQTGSKRKAPRKVAKTAVQAFNPSTFTGTYNNTYSDGVGGTVTDILVLNFDVATGTATGEYTNESGIIKKISGKLVGQKLECTYDEDGDEFATITIINANTLKLEGFTGTFKRVAAEDAAKPAPDAAVEVNEEAPVDPAFELLKNR